MRKEVHDLVRAGIEEERREFEKLENEKALKMRQLHPGDFVFVRKNPRNKHDTQYERQIYRVVHVKGRKVDLVTVFRHPWGGPKTLTTHIRHKEICRLDNEEFKEILEELLRHLMPVKLPSDAASHALSPPLPEALKEKLSDDKPKGPKDLQPLLRQSRAQEQKDEDNDEGFEENVDTRPKPLLLGGSSDSSTSVQLPTPLD